MTNDDLVTLVDELRRRRTECQWVEFKVNNENSDTLGNNISAIANAATLHDKQEGFIVFGVEDATHNLVGTSFSPGTTKVKHQELENWLTTQFDPRTNFKFYEINYQNQPLVICIIDAAKLYTIKFKGRAYIRVGSYTKPLSDHPDKERALWEKLNKRRFETELAYKCESSDEVLTLLDYTSMFKLLKVPLPSNKESILEKLEEEKVVVKKYNKYYITNLGALLFAADINKFEQLKRKAMRVVVYRGNDKISAAKKDQTGSRGYAVGFSGMMGFIDNQLPTNELLGEALRTTRKLYPELAIREFVANALIHQDFFVEGTGSMVEIFDNRIEITNPGAPLIPTDRFIDHAPMSRNEKLAYMMRRMGICEERGSGVDRAVGLCEVYQLPAPDFVKLNTYTRVTLFAPKTLRQMSKDDKIRAAYQHCSLKYVANDGLMTNETLRKRFSIEDKNYPTASGIIADAIDAKLIKPYDPTLKANRHQKYVPYWG